MRINIGPFVLASLRPLVAAAAAVHDDPGAPDAAALPLHPRFRSHLKCPYADRWLAKGPELAAAELGLDRNGRKLESSESSPLAESPVRGSCTHRAAFGGGTTCVQFHGDGWTDEAMAARCARESDGARSGDGCGDAAGWCDKAIEEGKREATAMVLSAMADCDGNKMACETWVGGTFVPDGECAADADAGAGGNMFGGAAGAPATMGGAGGGSYPGAAAAAGGDDSSMKCIIAPGAIGAAHQAGFSQGYSSSCPNAPGRDSPYMWPLRWAADTESQSMAYGSDDVVFKSRGRTFYMLDRNWKRSDTTYQEGQLRTIGQGPCEEGDNTGAFGCVKNQTDGTVTTMIHKGGLMYFIEWKEDETSPIQPGEVDASKIEKCTMMNLAVVGNIRPDWFLDKRGDDTDVQYLGDQHVYYADGTIPKS